MVETWRQTIAGIGRIVGDDVFGNHRRCKSHRDGNRASRPIMILIEALLGLRCPVVSGFYAVNVRVGLNRKAGRQGKCQRTDNGQH